jgi:hypothetical protein
MEKGNTGAWFNKQNHREFILIFDPAEEPPEGHVRAEPLPGAAYQRYDEEAGAWAADPDAEALERMDACKAELAAIDREAGAGRAVRALALAAAPDTAGDDYARLRGLEDRAEALRVEIAECCRQTNGTG